MNIVVSANNNEEIMVFPIIPRDIPLKNPQENEEFKTVNNGTLNLIGDLGLRSLSISSMFPKEKRSWAKAGSVEGIQYVTFFNKWRGKQVPIRLIITLSDGSELVNMAVTVDNFDYSFGKQEDITYSLDMKEYRFIL